MHDCWIESVWTLTTIIRKSSDLILDVPQSPSKGIPGNIITTNAGKMKNSGIELTDLGRCD